MSNDDVREKLRARKAELAQPQPALEVVTNFLWGFFHHSDSLEDAQRSMRRTARMNRDQLVKALNAIEELVQNPPEPVVLINLVIWEANYVLDDPTEAGAIEWLNEVARLTREVIAKV